MDGCSNLREARRDLYEQFRIQKVTVGTSEVQVLSVEIQDALRIAIEKLSDGEYQDSQIPKPVMANK